MIKTNKELKLTNLMSIRQKMTMKAIQQEMSNIEIYMEKNKIKKLGPVVTTTFSAEIENGEHLIDMEIMLPISNCDNLKAPYVLKEKLLITNAVKKKHIGDPNLIAKSYEELNKYIIDNKLQTITTAYNVSIKDHTHGVAIENTEVDIFIGVNPNKI